MPEPNADIEAIPTKGEPGHSRYQLNLLNRQIAQSVHNEPKTDVEIPVPLAILNDSDLCFAISWEKEDDDNESLALSLRAETMLESKEIKDMYIAGQKKLLQYDLETIQQMKQNVDDNQWESFESASDSEADLALSIGVAEVLEESIRQDEIPMAANKLNDSAPVEAVQN